MRTGREFSVRIGADYMRTKYFDANLGLVGQGNVRAVASFTYYVGGRRR